MARTDDDSWEITESVGATALGVAAARATETESENPLISDPFARVFLDAAGDGMWNMFGAGELPPELTEAVPEAALRMRAMVDYMASRTAFFDRFLLDATRAGVRQVVILAAGLDARAWRLPWPDGTTVYELDQPKVLEFKSSVLRDHGAQPTCDHVAVRIDLRQDWPAALRQAGFDASAAGAWLAEGLLPFLPAAAQDLLFERVLALSVAGSRIAVEAPGPDFNNPDVRERQRSLMRCYREVAAKAGQHEVPDFEDLWYFEDRTDVADMLRGHGWDVSAAPADKLMAGYGRSVPEQLDDGAPPSVFVAAVRSGA
ncbi:class I SAM-dependent methyltransferase [Mycobacterium decipiens]|uniref:S-adenosyl-L-methionine-dependent methyltransferase n=1 Tax=Mycobacterium decipiens TaxID=1430326 RepID=A0A1X2LZP4_9MYCO|nr:class I SAM-dependent methyltransferase [Mycobacterium decipiens]OSC42745.1 SAM-dependent methyltransferase [Mycobacterium decipiens]